MSDEMCMFCSNKGKYKIDAIETTDNSIGTSYNLVSKGIILKNTF
jgi:hypothetical protein